MKVLTKLHRSLRVPRGYFVLVISLFWVYLFIQAEVEGKFFPATSPMELYLTQKTTEVFPDKFTWTTSGEGNYTAFWLKAQRLRPTCGFVRIEWFLGKRTNTGRPGARIPVQLGPPLNRDEKAFFAGPWILQIHESRFNNTYADVIHSCGFLGVFREVRTQFWN